MLLAECDRGELTHKPGEGKDVRTTGHPPKKPVAPPERPSPSRDRLQEEERRASKPSLPPPPGNESKQVSSKPPFVPSPVQATPIYTPPPLHTSPICVGCRRPGVRTALYGEKRLCEWCAAARGYKVATPKAAFTPLPTQHASFGVLSEPPSTQHRPGERVLLPETIQAEPTPETLDRRTWEPITNRERWAYNMGRLCLACRARGETRQVALSFQGSRSVRLCEECARRVVE